eukprot:scaffold56048_cov17-Prasinocladus_malaysianus.AAC.1
MSSNKFVLVGSDQGRCKQLDRSLTDSDKREIVMHNIEASRRADCVKLDDSLSEQLKSSCMDRARNRSRQACDGMTH